MGERLRLPAPLAPWRANNHRNLDMPDLSSPLVLDALTRAAAGPDGLPLYGSRSVNGLFSATPSARKAAQQCKDEGWLRIVRTESRGKAIHEVCALTEKGLAYLLNHADVKPILQELVRAIDGRQTQLADLIDRTRQTQTSLDTLKSIAEQTLQRLQQPTLNAPAPPSNGHHGTPDAASVILATLARWQTSRAMEDCPLPELHRQTHEELPALTIGQFHDALRGLHEQQRIYLHPWTGPLYELPAPAFALLAGHEVAYYASKR